MAKLKDVARRASVSLSTASYALNNRPEISPGTRRRVLQAARELNYKPNGIARDLKRAKTRTVGILLSNLCGPFYSELIKAVEEVVFASDYNLIACSSFGGRNSTARRFLEEKRTDGLLILAQDIDDAAILRTASRSFPMVLLDRELDHPYVWSVTVHNQQGAYELVKHLIRLGYREIGFLSGPVNSYDNHHRFTGYQRALAEHHLDYSPLWTVQGHFTKQGGYHAARSLLLQGRLPQALFAANDEMALGALEAFDQAGVNVPEQLALVGFDDIELARYTEPPLTTISQPRYELGRIAAHLIFRALKGDRSLENIKLATRLVVRESCKRDSRKKKGV